MSSTATLYGFLRTHSELAHTIQTSGPFRDFLEQALKSSGADPSTVNPSLVVYRYTDVLGKAHESGQNHDEIVINGQPISIADLVSPQHLLDRRLLIHAIWCLEDFDALKAFVTSLGAVVRYSSSTEGIVIGHLLLASSILPLINLVERREYVLSNGDMASDAITRALGLRAKVFSLDRGRRITRPAEESLMDRFTRTIAKIR